MDIKKILLYFAVALVGTLIWMTWQKDYQPSSNVKQSGQVTTSQKAATPDSFAPPTFKGKSEPSTSTGATSATSKTTSQQKLSIVNGSNAITVKTDVLKVMISKVGGNFISAKLPKYPVSVKEKDTPIQILTHNPEKVYVAQSGITNIGNGKLVFSSAKNAYTLTSGEKTLAVTLTAKSKSGLKVTKTFTFTAGEYSVGQTVTVTNSSGKVWKGSFYNQITRKNVGTGRLFSRSYSGAAISSHDDPYQKLSFKKLSEENLSRNIENGWVAMQQPYFLTAWVPDTEVENHYYSEKFGEDSKGRGDVFVLGFVSPETSLAPGKSTTNKTTFYVGPELEKQLEAVAKGLELTIDYGWLWFLSKPIFYVMSAINHVVDNWGWSIILITLLIKIIFYPLSAKSYKSMAKMREVQPRLQALRERYKDDKQALGKATMDFYKREKVSPAGGCLPMLIQIPVFIALYYVLIESVQLRQAPFIFWIQDLSTKDPYHVLPILMAGSMFLQQRLSPPPPDPTQAKMMMFLPLVFLFIFWSFPAGLVLYWLTNNLLSILQQWYVMKTFDPKKEKKKRKKKK